jgi:nicotinamidase-related amidase
VVRTLLVIDVQNDYFPGGAYPLVGAEEAAERGRELLTTAREHGTPVVHLQHVSNGPDAVFFLPGTPGQEIHPALAPSEGEAVLVKEYPNGFRETPLLEQLEALGTDQLVVAGMMSSMCVDATVRAALDAGFSVAVAADACAAPDLEFAGAELPGATVHAAFMAALSDAGARVVPTEEIRAGSA